MLIYMEEETMNECWTCTKSIIGHGSWRDLVKAYRDSTALQKFWGWITLPIALPLFAAVLPFAIITDIKMQRDDARFQKRWIEHRPERIRMMEEMILFGRPSLSKIPDSIHDLRALIGPLEELHSRGRDDALAGFLRRWEMTPEVTKEYILGEMNDMLDDALKKTCDRVIRERTK